jgi:hypothetical protein
MHQMLHISEDKAGHLRIPYDSWVPNPARPRLQAKEAVPWVREDKGWEPDKWHSIFWVNPYNSALMGIFLYIW